VYNCMWLVFAVLNICGIWLWIVLMSWFLWIIGDGLSLREYLTGLYCPVLQENLGQPPTSLCSSRVPVWNLASTCSSSQPQLLGTVSLTMSRACQHLISINNAWQVICFRSYITYSLVSVKLSRTMLPLLSVRRPCYVYWHVMAP